MKIWFVLNIKNINICNVGPNTNGIGYISKHDTDFLQNKYLPWLRQYIKNKKCISSWLFMVINFPAMTFKMFPKNIFFCRSDIYKCKDFLFFSLPLKSTTEHECTLNFRKFLRIPTTIGSKVTSCVDNSFWNVFIPLISDLLCGQHNQLPNNRMINIVVVSIIKLITVNYHIFVNICLDNHIQIQRLANLQFKM